MCGEVFVCFVCFSLVLVLGHFFVVFSCSVTSVLILDHALVLDLDFDLALDLVSVFVSFLFFFAYFFPVFCSVLFRVNCRSSFLVFCV